MVVAGSVNSYIRAKLKAAKTFPITHAKIEGSKRLFSKYTQQKLKAAKAAFQTEGKQKATKHTHAKHGRLAKDICTHAKYECQQKKLFEHNTQRKTYEGYNTELFPYTEQQGKT